MFFTIKLYLHLNWILALNWIVWNRNIFINCTYWRLNCILVLNGIVWHRIIFIKMDLALNNLQRLICYKTQTTSQSNKSTKEQGNWLCTRPYVRQMTQIYVWRKGERGIARKSIALRHQRKDERIILKICSERLILADRNSISNLKNKRQTNKRKKLENRNLKKSNCIGNTSDKLS